MTEHISSAAAADPPMSPLTMMMAHRISPADANSPSTENITTTTDEIPLAAVEPSPSSYTPIRDLYKRCIEVITDSEPYLRVRRKGRTLVTQLQLWGTSFFGDQADLDLIFLFHRETAIDSLKEAIQKSLKNILYYLGMVILSERIQGAIPEFSRQRKDATDQIKKEIKALKRLAPAIMQVRRLHFMELDDLMYQNRGGVRFVPRRRSLEAVREAVHAIRIPENIPGPEKRGEIDMMKERMKAGVSMALNCFTSCFTLEFSGAVSADF
ncbi:hypothetical protein K440DRAFT_660583 [Wilcoxina mikolae CBS 423.85]|nr:hypothetical protein K440DRAFT_660583 [Wilcoxina mikolae CBS 423.85]